MEKEEETFRPMTIFLGSELSLYHNGAMGKAARPTKKL